MRIAFNREYEFHYVNFEYTYKLCKKMFIVSNYKILWQGENLLMEPVVEYNCQLCCAKTV